LKIGLHSISYAGYFYEGGHVSLRDMIPKAAKMGYEGVEVTAKRPLASPLDVDKHAVKELREVAESHGVEFPIIAAYADFTKPDALDREKELLYACACVRLANDLGSPIVRFYGGGDKIYREVPFKQQWEWAKEGVRYVSKVANDRGIKIALEPHTSVIQTHEDVLDMVEQIGSENIGICLDPPLLAIHKESVEKAIRAVGKLLLHAHVMDFQRKPVMVEYHALPGLAVTEITPIQDMPLGEGEVDIKTFVRVGKEIGYTGYLSYEVCVPFHLHHRVPTIQDVDRMVAHASRYLRSLLQE